MATLAEAADENLVTHVSWVVSRVAGMHVRADAELVLADSGLPCDTFNVVCRARFHAQRAQVRIPDAVEYFRRARRPFSWWVGPADRPDELGAVLVDCGLARADTELAMAADLGGLRGSEPPPRELEIRRVRTADDLRDFARVSAANWSPPDAHVRRFYESAAPLLLAPGAPQWLYVGYLVGEPVATSELTVGGGVAGLYNISTLEPHRRRGFGTALTLQPLRDALAHGYRTCVLHAAADGVRLYQRVGFQRFGEITEYKPPPPGGGAS